MITFCSRSGLLPHFISMGPEPRTHDVQGEGWIHLGRPATFNVSYQQVLYLHRPPHHATAHRLCYTSSDSLLVIGGAERLMRCIPACTAMTVMLGARE